MDDGSLRNISEDVHDPGTSRQFTECEAQKNPRMIWNRRMWKSCFEKVSVCATRPSYSQACSAPTLSNVLARSILHHPRDIRKKWASSEGNHASSQYAFSVVTTVIHPLVSRHQGCHNRLILCIVLAALFGVPRTR